MRKVPFLNYIGVVLFMIGSLGLFTLFCDGCRHFADAQAVQERQRAIQREAERKQEMYAALQISVALLNAEQTNWTITITPR